MGTPTPRFGDERFPPTHWSVICKARDAGAADGASLARLCQTYWYPLYAFARRSGRNPPDAQDLTQGFFEHVLHGRLLRSADASKGRFRSYLLGCFRHFIQSDHARAMAEKRGGQCQTLSLDHELAEVRFGQDLSDPLDPALLYDRNWALTLVTEVTRQLEREFEASGRGEVFRTLSPLLLGDKSGASHADAARALQWAEASVKVMVWRMRRRFRALFKEQVAQTVDDPAHLDEELRHLLQALQQ